MTPSFRTLTWMRLLLPKKIVNNNLINNLMRLLPPTKIVNNNLISQDGLKFSPVKPKRQDILEIS
jgi:hypothetical protein